MLVKQNNAPEITQDLDLLVTWMSDKSIRARTKVFVKHTTNECLAMVKAIDYKLDINTLDEITDVDQVNINDIVRMKVRASKPLFIDAYATNRTTGSVILIDEQTNETIGAGMIVNN